MEIFIAWVLNVIQRFINDFLKLSQQYPDQTNLFQKIVNWLLLACLKEEKILILV